MIDLLLCLPPHHRALQGLTLPTLKQYLESKGFTIWTIEKPQNNEEIIDFVQTYQPRFIGISVPFTFYYPSALKLIGILKLVTDIPIIVGGAHATIRPQDFPTADYICKGYGEQYLYRLLSGQQPTPGLDMDDMPCITSRENIETACNGVRCMRYMSSRGCVFNCSFCPNKLLSGNRIHYRSLEKVIDDLHEFKKQNITKLWFNDETFTLKRERTMNLCEQMINDNLKFSWWCQTRANLIDEELIQTMHKAGCFGISFGVESGDERVLQDCNKGVTLTDILTATKLCREKNVLSYGGFIIGHPGDTMKSVKRSVEFSCESKLDYAGFGLMMPFPGTRVREQALQDGGIVCNDYSKYHVGEILYIPPGLNNVDLKKVLWWSCGKFMNSSIRRLWLNGVGYTRQKGWKPKADFMRRICYGIVG